MKIIKNYINGNHQSSPSSKIDVYDPSKGEVISQVVSSNEEDFKLAIKSSINAFEEWQYVTPLKRSRILAKFKNLIENNIETLAKTVSEEHGKTLDDAKGSIIRGLEVVEFATGIPHLLKGEFSQNVGSNIDSWSILETNNKSFAC